MRNFLAVLIDHRRITFLGPIVKQFEHELDDRMGFAEAEITSARELDDAERRALEAQVEILTGKKVRARYLARSVDSRRSHREGWQHHLRWVGERPVGEDKTSD